MTSAITPPVPAPEALERAFERDLAWLASELGAGVVSAESVSPLRGLGHPRAAFRVTLTDGRLVKLRRMSEVDEAARLEELLDALVPLGLPRVLARRGRVLALEWVPGEVLSTAPGGHARALDAARLLGRMHRVPAGAVAHPSGERLAADEIARAGKQLAALVRSGRLCAGEADGVAAALAFHVPRAPDVGIVHGDLAPENLVVTASGRLCPIDNEVVRIGVLDLDLARTWSRWPMAPEAWRSFLGAYGVASRRARSDEELVGWKVRTLTASAWYRVAFRAPGADEALARLLEFTRSLSVGTT